MSEDKKKQQQHNEKMNIQTKTEKGEKVAWNQS